MEEMTMTKSIFEQLGGAYEQQGDYLLPCLTVPAENEQPIGVWGQRHLRYLKEYRRAAYITLLKRQAERLPCRHRQAGAGAHGKAHRADETGAGYHRAAKGGKRLRMGAENE